MSQTNLADPSALVFHLTFLEGAVVIIRITDPDGFYPVPYPDLILVKYIPGEFAVLWGRLYFIYLDHQRIQ